MVIEYPAVTLVAVLLVNYIVVELYKLLHPDKPVSPRAVNAIVAPMVGAVVAALSRGEPASRALLFGIAALGAFLSASGIHAVHHAVRED